MYEFIKLKDGQVGVRAQVRVTVPQDDGKALLRFIASTSAIDRYGEVIDPKGWDLTAYRKNPVFQNAHRYGDVLHTLGRATRIEVGELQPGAGPVLWMEVEFAVKENPVAAVAYRLYRGGFLNAVSVGFIPVAWTVGGKGDEFRTRYIHQELVEVSAVAVPANREALRLDVAPDRTADYALPEAAALLRAMAHPARADGKTILRLERELLAAMARH